MTTNDLEQSILNHVQRAEYRPVKPRVIAKQLGLPKDDLSTFKRLLKKMVKKGQLVYGSNHLIGPPSMKTGQVEPTKKPVESTFVTGTFRRAQGGFGFVRPRGAGADHQRENDYYIAQEDTLDAASGDLVLVKPKRDRGVGQTRRFRGEIVEVLERDTHQFVGTYFESAGSAYVQVDGTVFAKPIAVGDPGAKNAQPDDKVVFEMVRFPTQSHDGEGVITEVLGSRAQAGVDTLMVIREFSLPEGFPDDVLEAARQEADKFDESIPPGREDLTAETIITIDPVDARDFDDAISLKKLDNGHWLLGVHIADVSHFVQPGNPLDREAHARATSVYLPDRVLPMLPEVISNGLASLQPDRVRYAKTCFMEFTAEGIRVATDLKTTAIRSKRRFTYEEVDEYLADVEAWRVKLTPEVHGLLGLMHELALILRGRRTRRGSLELTLGEVKVDLDKEGRVIGAHHAENTVSHQMIEEFMLSANEAVAEALAEKGLLFLRRVHMSPDPRKLKALTEFVTGLGFEVESLESRFELQRLLKLVKDQPEAHAVNFATLRSLQRAAYGPQEEGHYALASDCYCHFTSPIRRYPDLTIHRLITDLEAKKKPKNDLMALTVLGEHCSDRERRAEEAERELTNLKLLNYLSGRIGHEMDAIITGVEEFGLFAEGVDLPVQGLIHITSLSDDYYHFERRSHTLTGRRAGNAFRLGDKVRVTVAHVDVDRRELDFRIVGVKPKGGRVAPGRRHIKAGGRVTGKIDERPAKKTSKPHGQQKRKKLRRKK